MSDREEFQAARDAGLAIRQQRRIETREELRRRTRREVAEEIAAALAAEQDLMSSLPVGDPAVSQQARLVIPARASAFRDAARIAREIGTR